MKKTYREKYDEFKKDLEGLINKHSLENFSDTPDFILAEYLVECLKSYAHTHNRCNGWHTADSCEDAGNQTEAPTPGTRSLPIRNR